LNTDSTAVIHPGAELHPTVQVGPYAVIGASESWPETVLGAHVVLEGPTEMVHEIKFSRSRDWLGTGISSMMATYRR